jgi:pSer/pThr/pTyr-binding forkhead associated (FHA) protein
MAQTELNQTPETLTNLQFADVHVESVDESLIPSQGVSFYIVRLARAIVVHTGVEFFIGRDVGEDVWKPLVDLGEVDGYSMGVSRRHAMVRPVEHGYEIIDLFSTNGTWLDGQRLIPNIPYTLAPGSQLRVGQELILVIYRSAHVTTR